VRLGRGAIVMSVECQGARPGVCVARRRRTDCVNVLNGAYQRTVVGYLLTSKLPEVRRVVLACAREPSR
jgi:hypothetical protein